MSKIPTAEEFIYSFKDKVFYPDSPDTSGTAIDINDAINLTNNFAKMLVEDIAVQFAEWMLSVCKERNEGTTYTISEVNCETLGLNPNSSYSATELFGVFKKEKGL